VQVTENADLVTSILNLVINKMKNKKLMNKKICDAQMNRWTETHMSRWVNEQAGDR
jgi:hypothetical protein